MFNFFKKKPPAGTPPTAAVTPVVVPPERKTWLARLKLGLRKTGTGIATVFTGTRIDDELYENLESALLMADSGVKATQYLLDDLKRRVKDAHATDPAAVRELLVESITSLLLALEKPLVIGQHKPTVIMVTGVNAVSYTHLRAHETGRN